MKTIDPPRSSHEEPKDIVLETLRTYGHQGLELEFRVGKKLETFVPGVSKDVWDGVKTRMDAFGYPQSIKTTVEHIRDDGLKKIEEEGSASVSWMTKERIVHVDSETYRLSLAKETILKDPPSIRYHLFSHTRYKHRISYFFKIWRLDLTKVTSNDPRDLDNDQETYELELELADPTAFFVYTVDHILQWGSDVLERVLLHV